MTPLILALIISAADPSAGSAQPTDRAAAQSSGSVSAALKEAQENYDRVVQLYKDSCENRAYGAYDDLCEQVKKQVHQYRVDLDRQERIASDQTAAPRPHR